MSSRGEYPSPAPQVRPGDHPAARHYTTMGSHLSHVSSRAGGDEDLPDGQPGERLHQAVQISCCSSSHVRAAARWQAAAGGGLQGSQQSDG